MYVCHDNLHFLSLSHNNEENEIDDDEDDSGGDDDVDVNDGVDVIELLTAEDEFDLSQLNHLWWDEGDDNKDHTENDNDDNNCDVIVLLSVGVRKSLTFPSSITLDEREQLLFPTNPPPLWLQAENP